MMVSNKLLSLINAYKVSNALFVAAKIKLFDYIDGKRSINEIAKKAGTNVQSLKILLEFFCSLDLLVKVKEEIYDIPKAFMSLLVSSSSKSMIPLMELERHFSFHYSNLEKMEQILLTGAGFDEFNQNKKDQKEDLYGSVMEAGGKYSSLLIAREFRNAKVRRILDIGGGAGTHAVAICRQIHNAEVDIVDKSEMQMVCMEHICKNNMGKRIQFFPGDIFEINLKKKYDGVLVSNVLHLFDDRTNIRLLKYIENIMDGGGTLLLHDFFKEDSKKKDLISSLYTLDWLMQGSFFSGEISDVKTWLREGKLNYITSKSFEQIPTSIIVIVK